MRWTSLPIRSATLLLALFLPLSALSVQDNQPEDLPEDLTELTLEELMGLKITSVSKKEEVLYQAPTAIRVLTREDIRHSGHRSVPELLRMVPGVHVARIDANKWAISARGFNGRFAGKMLVLVDGRSVYSPLFSGVFWDTQDLHIDDIERIEVIRGPGASVWGANAMNGVVNIITRHTKKTQGTRIEVGGGTEDKGFASIRHGGPLGENGFFRVWGKAFDHDSFEAPSGSESDDDWDMAQGGVRFDWSPTDGSSFTLEAVAYDGEAGTTLTLPSILTPPTTTFLDTTDLEGGHLRFVWNRSLSEDSAFSIHASFTHTERLDALFGEERSTLDIEFRHDVRAGNHDIIWGLGHRTTQDEMTDSFWVTFADSKRSDHTHSVFFQDQISVVEGRLDLILGVRVDDDEYSGVDAQPNARVVWTPDEENVVWASVMRAVRTPSRGEDSVEFDQASIVPPPVPPAMVTVFGSESLDAEELVSYEIGWRTRISRSMTLDLATFFNRYDDLIGAIPSGTPFPRFVPVLHTIIPMTIANSGEGESYGLEALLQIVPGGSWRATMGYSYLRVTSSGLATGQDPVKHQFFVHGAWHPSTDVDLSATVYYVEHLSTGKIPSYTRVDARAAWRPSENVEVTIVGQNLLDDAHQEFGDSFGDSVGAMATDVERAFYVSVVYRP